MTESMITNLIGMKIIGQHGRAIGIVTDMSADIETWQLRNLEVKLNRTTLDELKLKRPNANHWCTRQRDFGSDRQPCPQTPSG